jgi:hypothetical protein
MRERLVHIPFYFDGTAAADTGTVVIVPPIPLAFRYGAIHAMQEGGTVTVTSEATGQGTVTLSTLIGGGSAFVGSAAFGTAGTAIKTLVIPRLGSVWIQGSTGTGAGTPSQLSGYVAFALGE